MKITGIECTVVYAKRNRAYGRITETALGRASVSEYAVVRVHTDRGITGIGEISSVFEKKGRALSAEVDTHLTPVLLGRDPFRISEINTRMAGALEGSEPAKAAIDMALYDIVGKALDTPVYNLLGGLVRERVPLSYSIPFGTPEEMAEFGLDKARQGFRTVKVKIGQSHERDVEAVRRVREAVGPHVTVRVDANMSFRSVEGAIRTIKAIEPSNPELIEQPLPPERLEETAAIRAAVDVPIMLDESIWSPRHAFEALRHGAADIANVYVSESGGIQNAVQIFNLCELHDVPCMIGSMPELGIGTAAHIHLGLAMRNLKLDSDCCGSEYHEEDLLTTPLRIVGGDAYPPLGPGLGIELDEAVIERWRSPPEERTDG